MDKEQKRLRLNQQKLAYYHRNKQVINQKLKDKNEDRSEYYKNYYRNIRKQKNKKLNKKQNDNEEPYDLYVARRRREIKERGAIIVCFN
jgi:dTDP-4-amino-4,6-dideoxygalactose transaminase